MNVRKIGKRVMSALLALCMTGLLTVCVGAEEGEAWNVGFVSGAGVRMRAEPGTTSEIEAVLAKDTVVAVEGIQDGWYEVSVDGQNGYIRNDYLILNDGSVFSCNGIVNADEVNIRAEADTDSEVISTADTGEFVAVSAFDAGWYQITTEKGTEGYIRSDLLNLSTATEDPRKTEETTDTTDTTDATTTTTTTSNSSVGSSIIATAKQYIGVRYVYGGASPSGFDCSGFTMYVYAQYGVSLAHSATSQWQSGKGTQVYSQSALQVGDLVFFCDPSRSLGKACSHVGMYVGGGQFIHASSSKGVTISSLGNSYYARYFKGGLHIL